ncbi:hypothetical protein O181_112760 [Austropuccinia psidii MF-1]|uniref:Uncharacterized protein n=1 Tax=Austropuccinia psidii MF-1 TaxID=1389203 RepID=A0A9Q3K143_9BASI|nr:hypothetical protein [Austropuccinia psidii MF-1]
MAFLGHLGRYGLYGTWAVITVQGPRPVGQLGQRAQPTSPQGQVGLKPQLGPPEPNLDTNHHGAKMAINQHRTHFGPGSPWTTFQPMAPGSHQRPPDLLNFPLTLRGILPFLHAPCTQGCRSGAYMVLYTIMHHFCSEIQW